MDKDSATEGMTAVDYERFFSERARTLPQNPFVHLLPLMRDPKNKVLCQGVPPDVSFPLQRLSCSLVDGTTVDLSLEDVKLAQRYPPFAWGPLREWLLHHVRELHMPPCPDWDVAVAAGSMSSVDLACALLLDRGDCLLVEEYSFMASLDAFRSYGAQLVPVAMDAEGMRPEALEAACEKLKAQGRRAKALYAIPVGQNPTGSVLSTERYQRIYDLARRFDFLIVEDDAYFYQQHERRDSGASAASELPGLKLGTTFFSLDTEGRVLRLDSFSKVLAPGFRLGWVSGPRPLVTKYNALAYASSQNGCSLSIMLLGRALEAWGAAGFEAHLLKLQSLLRDRCGALVAAAEQQLGGEVASWERPRAGMFLWVRLKRPPADDAQLLDGMRAHGVAVLPGSYCRATPQAEDEPCPFVRLSFVVDEGEYPEAMKRLAEALQGLA